MADEIGPVPADKDNSGLSLSDFPKGFIVGTATAAYQVEGAAAKGGRGLTVWDEFCLRTPGKIVGGVNGNVACEMYYRYREDIRMMKAMGFNTYRFSIAWSRILPSGRCSGGINQEAVDYYNDVIDTVLKHEMIPYVTIFHWDLPLPLQNEYGGFIEKKIKDDFAEYAELCFWLFGDRVKYWATLNEPWTYTINGYVTGEFPPGRKIPSPLRKRTNINPDFTSTIPTHRSTRAAADAEKDDDSATAEPWEAYTVARNLLLAHAEAVKVYREKFQKAQQGKIGIVNCCFWFVPYHDTKEDREAVKRALDFMLGWFVDPVLYGKYPDSMIKNVPQQNLAPFSDEESKMLKNSVDFLGINYYTAQYVAYSLHPTRQASGYYVDQKNYFTQVRDGTPIGPKGGISWMYVVPYGIYYLLAHVEDTYGSEGKEIYITENGYCTENDYKLTAKEVCNNDVARTKYHQDHLANILKVMKDKKMEDKVKGYFVWSWCDNLEWATGYAARFGLVYIDFVNDLRRYPKDAAAWFCEFFAKKELEKEKEKSLQTPFGAHKRALTYENEPGKRMRIVEDGE